MTAVDFEIEQLTNAHENFFHVESCFRTCLKMGHVFRMSELIHFFVEAALPIVTIAFVSYENDENLICYVFLDFRIPESGVVERALQRRKTQICVFLRRLEIV